MQCNDTVRRYSDFSPCLLRDWIMLGWILLDVRTGTSSKKGSHIRQSDLPLEYFSD
jgi:hypothetical protein